MSEPDDVSARPEPGPVAPTDPWAAPSPVPVPLWSPAPENSSSPSTAAPGPQPGFAPPPPVHGPPPPGYGPPPPGYAPPPPGYGTPPPPYAPPGSVQPGSVPPGYGPSVPGPVGPPVEERPDPGTWTFLDVLSGLGLVMLLSTLLTWPFLVWSGAPPVLVLVVAGLLPIWIGMFGMSWWAVRHRGTGNWRRDLGLQFKPVDLAIGLGVGLGCRLAAGVIFLVLSQLQGGMGQGNLETVTGGLSDAALWFVMVGAVTFVAPVVEEIFFRGLLLRSLGSTMVRTRPAWTAARRRQVACLVSAALFTAVHLTELSDPLSVLPLVLTWFGLGYITAQLTLTTGRLGPAIVSHIVFNGVATVALLSM